MKLTVLMWKHMKARRRNYSKTVFELLLPILVLGFALLIKNLIYNVQYETANHDSFVKLNSPKQVLYYPPTAKTKKIMERVGEKLNLSSLDRFPGAFPFTVIKYFVGNGTSGIYGIQNISAVEDMDTIDENTALVMFGDLNNLSSRTYPDKLIYTIKVRNKSKQDSTKLQGKTFEDLGLEPFPESFMSLQWALDNAYLNINHGIRNFQDISIEPLKNPENVKAKLHVLLVMHIFCFMSMGVIFMIHVSRVMAERVNGTQALITMAGVSSTLYNLSHLLNAMLFGVAYTAGVIVFLILSIDKPPMLQYSNLFLVALMVFMYYVNTIALGFFTCYLLSDTRHVLSSSAGFYGLSFLPSLFLYKVKFVRPYLQIMFGLLPHVPSDWFWGHLAQLEANGIGLNKETMIQYNSTEILKPYVAYIMMLVQFFVYSFATYYLSLVRPGKFTSPLPWDFLFDKAFWYGAKLHCDVELIADLHGPSEKYRQYFEPRPLRRHLGLRIVNVSKIYATTTALQKVTLNIQRGEIYVLLGHNGAGKTTLLNIVAGMEHATTGKVYVNGLDISTHRNKIKRFIGVCPQQSILIPELTVIEHIMFFTMIRQNITFRAARYAALHVLKQLGLENKEDHMIYKSSANIKRRLQLGCALAGETNVLILDEPTSGLDVESRRRLWDLLLSFKTERTVLLSTHFMEEADALGDRVAALHVGRLRCDATPMYLKSAVGKGYRLTLMTIGPPNLPRIVENVIAKVPEATMMEGTVNCVVFDLPPRARETFPNLFKMLEEKRDELAIQSIGIGTVTLEEVFFRLCSDVHVSFREVDVGIQENLQPQAKGLRLYKQQLAALWHRQIQYYVAYKYSFLLLEFIVPVFMLVFLTYATNSPKSNRPSRQFSALSMDLTSYDDISDKKVLLHLDPITRRNFRPKYENTYKSVEFEYVPDSNNDAFQLKDNSSLYRGNVLFGIHLNETNAKILYSPTVRSSAPVALNLLTNMLAERSQPNADTPLIVTYIEPINTKNNTTIQLHNEKIKNQSDIFNWALFVSLLTTATAIHSVTLLSRERLSGTRRIFIIYGCSPILYWVFTWLFHTLFYIVILVVPVLVITIIFEGDGTLDQVGFRAALGTIVVLGVMAYLTLMYLVSLYGTENVVIVVGIILVLVFGMVTPTCQSLMKEYPHCCSFLPHVITFIEYTIPPHTFTSDLLKAGKVARINALCKIMRRFCPNVKLPTDLDVWFDIKYCCASTGDMQCYFCLGENGLAGRFFRAAVQSIVYMTLVILSQMGMFNGIWDRIINRNYKPLPFVSDDPFITKEITHVNDAIRLPQECTNNVAVVQNLHKRYRTLRQSTVAVEGVTFSVRKGECLGIVGLPGAGKSTIMRMLVGAEYITRGKVFCNGIPARVRGSNRVSTEYLRTLGYCTQKHNLDEFRTGEDNLATLLKLRGYNTEDVKKGVESWIHIVALEKHSEKRVWSYSGGCKRRLAAAAAMMAGGALTLLDEPTAGIDVAARREVWLALADGLKAERAALVTSSTMQDMEALCNRVCILVNGQVKALATPSELRATHDKRYVLQIFLNPDEEVTTPESLRQIDWAVRGAFKCKLIDGHRSMLQYRISRTLTYSDIFREADQLKLRFTAILDYSFKEPMLEEVYKSFVKKQKRPKVKRNSWFRYA